MSLNKYIFKLTQILDFSHRKNGGRPSIAVVLKVIWALGPRGSPQSDPIGLRWGGLGHQDVSRLPGYSHEQLICCKPLLKGRFRQSSAGAIEPSSPLGAHSKRPRPQAPLLSRSMGLSMDWTFVT